MEEIVFYKSLEEKVKKMGISITDSKKSHFYKYMILLLEWNKKMNLTAITNPEDIILKHFIDSISIIPYIKESNEILDIGTGAGFPGIPLKIIEDNKNFTLLDSLNKRIIFLQHVIDHLNLNKIQAIHGRAEEFI